MITFILTQGKKSRPLHFEQELISIGRAKESLLRIPDKKTSREHAKIERIGATYQISDLESGNGTKVNGKRIDFHVLADGDEILIGDAHLLVRSIDGDPAEAAKGRESEPDLLAEAAPLPELPEGETELRISPPAQKANPAARA